MIHYIAKQGASALRYAGLTAFLLLLSKAGIVLAQQAYPTAEAAAEAFTAALGKPAMMAQVLGADWKRFIPTDEIEEEHLQAYLEAWEKRHEIVPEPDDPDSGTRVVAVGTGDWTLPIPLVNSEAGWRFDLVAGAEEMQTRRIGRNELAAINASLAYYDAQREYAERDRDGDGFREYAQRIVSTPGQTDGLYWARLDDEEESPLGPYFADEEPGADYHGYLHRVLTAQGPAARGGAYDYMVDGRLRGGFALIAWPSKYEETGVMTFIVNHDGTVYETDFGPETDTIARAVETFDPDEAWTAVNPGRSE